MAEPENKELEKETLTATNYEELPEGIKNIFKFFLGKYVPAKHHEPKTVRLTTLEIYTEIFELCYQAFPISVVFDFMNDHKFIYDEDGDDKKLTWLLRLKN